MGNPVCSGEDAETRSIVSQACVAAAAVDAEGRLLAANAAACSLWRLADAPDGAAFTELFPLLSEDGELLPFLRTPPGRLTAGELVALPLRARARHADGTSTPVLVTAAPIPGGAIAWFYDTSAEQRVAESEQHTQRLLVLGEASRLLTEAGFDFENAYRAIVRHVCVVIGDACILTAAGPDGVQKPIAIDHRDPDRRELLIKTAMGGPPGSGIGLAGPVYATGRAMRLASLTEGPFAEAIAARPLVAEYLRTVGISSLLVVPLRAGDRIIGTLGVARDLEGRSYTADDEALLQDLGDRAGLVFEKARLYREAQEALAQRESFLSVASHELRTPLSTMRLQLQSTVRQLRRGTGPSAAQVMEKLTGVDEQVSVLTQLVDDLLDVSRIAAGRLRLDPEPLELNTLVGGLLERFEEPLTNAGCALLWQAGERITGKWDRARLDQIITNLLTNAMKYGKAQPIQVHVKPGGLGAQVSVRDYGIGIAPESQQRVFERFERAVSSRNYSGFGLGLWISRQLARAHGGEIRLSSELGKGSTFVLDLPLSIP